MQLEDNYFERVLRENNSDDDTFAPLSDANHNTNQVREAFAAELQSRNLTASELYDHLRDKLGAMYG